MKAGHGNDTVTGGGGRVQVTLGNGNDSVTLGGNENFVAVGTGTDTISFLGGGNTVIGGGGQLSIALNGANNLVWLAGGATSIADHSKALWVQVAASPDTQLTVTSFNAASHSVVDLVGSTFASVSAVLSALQTDGAGGTILSVGSAGEVHFVDLFPRPSPDRIFRLGNAWV